jgi:hypothetical protein
MATGVLRLRGRSARSLGKRVRVKPDLAFARLRHIAGTRWGTRRYLDMDRLREQEQEEQAAEAGAIA